MSLLQPSISPLDASKDREKKKTSPNSPTPAAMTSETVTISPQEVDENVQLNDVSKQIVEKAPPKSSSVDHLRPQSKRLQARRSSQAPNKRTKLGHSLPFRHHSTPVITSRPEDIICGRLHGRHNPSDGNRVFHELVESQRLQYDRSAKLQKTKINKHVVDQMLKEKRRFLTEDPIAKIWVEMSYEKCLQKTSQTFRDLKKRPKSISSIDNSKMLEDKKQLKVDDVKKLDDTKKVKVNKPSSSKPVLPTSKRPNSRQPASGQSTHVTPREADIICGRSHGRHHPSAGNRAFHESVESLRSEYNRSFKLQKSAISKAVVDQMHKDSRRFLKEDPKSKRWVEMPYEKCLQKTSQTFRDFKRKPQTDGDDVPPFTTTPRASPVATPSPAEKEATTSDSEASSSNTEGNDFDELSSGTERKPANDDPETHSVAGNEPTTLDGEHSTNTNIESTDQSTPHPRGRFREAGSNLLHVLARAAALERD